LRARERSADASADQSKRESKRASVSRFKRLSISRRAKGKQKRRAIVGRDAFFNARSGRAFESRAHLGQKETSEFRSRFKAGEDLGRAKGTELTFEGEPKDGRAGQ